LLLQANSDNMEQVSLALGLRRLAKVTMLTVTYGEVTDQLAQAILVHPALKDVDMAGAGASLARLDPHLLARAFVTIEKVNLEGVRLSPAQLAALFHAMATSDHAITNLNLWDTSAGQPASLAGVEPDLLARALGGLKEVHLGTDLTRAQLETLLPAWAGAGRLSSLDLYGNPALGEVAPTLLTSIAPKLVVLDLSNTGLSDAHLTPLLAALFREDRLKELFLAEVDLSGVEVATLAKLVARLERAEIEDTDLDPSQVTAILAAAATSPSLKMLGLGKVARLEDREMEARARANIELYMEEELEEEEVEVE